jgi:hypothetical protein
VENWLCYIALSSSTSRQPVVERGALIICGDPSIWSWRDRAGRISRFELSGVDCRLAANQRRPTWVETRPLPDRMTLTVFAGFPILYLIEPLRLTVSASG